MITIPRSFIILTHKRLPHIFGIQKSIFLSNVRQAEFERLKSNSKNTSVQLQSLLQKAYNVERLLGLGNKHCLLRLNLVLAAIFIWKGSVHENYFNI
jgi:hypothetical protein